MSRRLPKHPAEKRMDAIAERIPAIDGLVDAVAAARREGALRIPPGSWDDPDDFPIAGGALVVCKHLIDLGVSPGLSEAGLAIARRAAGPGWLDPEWVCLYDKWRRSKQILRFDEDLARALKEQELGGAIPVEALRRMPFETFFADCPLRRGDTSGPVESVGAWFYLSVSAEGDPGLYIVYLDRDGALNTVCLSLACETIEEAVDEVVDADAALLRKLEEDGSVQVIGSLPSADETRRIVAEALNLLLYVCSDGADLRTVRKESAARTSAKRAGTSTAGLVEVGTRVGAALRSSGRRAAGAGEPGAQKAPHMRRAHWHAYWTGPRDSETRAVVVKWIPPIAVNADKGCSITGRTYHRRSGSTTTTPSGCA